MAVVACPHCGVELNAAELRCPHCGRANRHARPDVLGLLGAAAMIVGLLVYIANQ